MSSGSVRSGPEQKIIPRKNANLLVRSETIAENYPWLKQILESKEFLDAETCSQLPNEQRRIIEETLAAIEKQASNEWQAVDRVSDLGGSHKQCTLCNTKIRWECYIRNTLTGEEIIVGRECVKHFGFRVDGNKSIEELVKDAARLRRRQNLDDRFRGMHQQLDQLYSFLGMQSILIPERLERPFLSTGAELRQVYDNYLEGKVSERLAVPRMESLWRALREHRLAVEQYTVEHQGDTFRPSRKMVRFLSERGRVDALRWLKEDEVITARTLHRIEEPEFLQSITQEWNRVLGGLGVVFLSIHETGGRYVWRINQWKQIRFVIGHESLSLLYGPMIFGEEPTVRLSLDAILNESSLYDGGSVGELFSLLLPAFRGLGFSLYHQDDLTDSVVFQDSSNSYILLDRRRLAEEFKSVVLGTADLKTSLLKYINESTHRRFSVDQIRSLEEARRQYTESQKAPNRRRR